MDQSMIDTASGRVLVDKTPTTVRLLISYMTSNTQQNGIRGVSPSRMVNEISVVDNLRLENQLTELTSLVRQLAVGQHKPSIAAKVCGICTFVEYPTDMCPTDMCPTLQETESDNPESIGAIGGYQYGKQLYQSRQFDNQQFGRAICGSAIWICSKCTSKSKWLSATESTIPGTTVPTTATIESAITRQLTISGGPDEAVRNKKSGVPAKHELQQYAVPAKYKSYHPRPQDVNRTASQHYE
ncbi:hypothetical protein CR513_16919, partial [Mucuna pruriens]